MKGSYILFLIFGLCGPSCMNLGMGMEKYGIDAFGQIKDFFRGGKVAWKLTVWALGSLLTLVAVVFGFMALKQGGNASTLGALAGFGLIVLVLFSYFILKEVITARELTGIFIIMIGTSMMGFFSREAQSSMKDINRAGMIWFFISYGIFWLLGIIAMKIGGKGVAGVIMGVLSGSLGGVGVVFQKVITDWMFLLANGKITMFQFFGNGYVYLCFGPGLLSFIVLQFAYKYGKAVTVVPSMNSALIVFPTIVALAVLSEPVLPVQWISLAVIVIGVLFISSPKMAAEPAPKAA